MKVEMVKIAELIPYARNARTHSESQIKQIASSIREFGFMAPILIDDKKNIIAGHGRVSACELLKMKEVPCVIHSHLTTAQRRAYILADNKLALNAGYDDEMLRIEKAELQGLDFDLSLTGFNTEEIALLNIDASAFEAGTEDEQGQLDVLSPKMVKCPTCGGEFDAREHGI